MGINNSGDLPNYAEMAVENNIGIQQE
jgi:hypothetical protein